MNVTSYRADVFHSGDLTESKKGHVSISGGKASHSFTHIESITAPTLAELKDKVRFNYGEHYDIIDGRYFIGIPEKDWCEKDCPENYEVSFTKVIESVIE